MNLKNFFKLITAIAVSELAGVIGSLFTVHEIGGWYATLQKPALNPPAWIFAPVWTTLFALMGISLFIIWKNYSLIRENKKILSIWKIGIALFFVQLILNTLWSIIFFGLHNPVWAFADIIFLWFAIFATIFAFAKISPPSSSIWTTAGHGKLAAWLLVPYILWVSFAGYLNYSIWQLNNNPKDESVFCTQEAKLCPDGSYVGRTGPKCEFAACPNKNVSLPIGYTLDSYLVENVSEISCVKSIECKTPNKYLVQSRCPFTSLCLQNKCTVVCPSYVK